MNVWHRTYDLKNINLYNNQDKTQNSLTYSGLYLSQRSPWFYYQQYGIYCVTLKVNIMMVCQLVQSDTLWRSMWSRLKAWLKQPRLITPNKDKASTIGCDLSYGYVERKYFSIIRILNGYCWSPALRYATFFNPFGSKYVLPLTSGWDHVRW